MRIGKAGDLSALKGSSYYQSTEATEVVNRPDPGTKLPRRGGHNDAQKLTPLGATIAAVAALVVPASAGATTLTEDGGATLVPVGESVVLTQDPNHPLVMHHYTIGDMDCEEVVIPAVVTQNGGGEVEVVATEGSAAPCGLNGEYGAQILKFEGSIFSNESGKGTAGLMFEMELPQGLVCTFEMLQPEPVYYEPGSDGIEFSYSEPAFFDGGPCSDFDVEGRLLLKANDGTTIEID